LAAIIKLLEADQEVTAAMVRSLLFQVLQ